MATRLGISSITKGDFILYLANKPDITRNPLLRVLATPKTLSWDTIQQIIDSRVVSTLSPQLKPYVELVLSAKALETILKTGKISGDHRKVLLEALRSIRASVPNIAVREVMLAVIGYITLVTMEATDGLDLNEYYAILNYLEEENLYGDLTMLKTNLHNRYLEVLSIGSTSTSVWRVKKQLSVFVGMKQHRVSMDYNALKQIAINTALSRVASVDTLPEDRQELLRLLTELDEDESRQTVVRFSREYSVSTIPPPESCQAIWVDPIPVPGVKGAGYPDDIKLHGVIQSSSQVQLEQHPITANTYGDPHVYVYEATFVYDGRTYPAIVKQFVSTNEERAKRNGLNERNILARLSRTNTSYFLRYYGSYLERQPGGNYCYSVAMEKYRSDLMEDFSKRMNPKQPYTENYITFIVRSLLEAFAIMGAKKIYHCDVNPCNIFIADDGNLKIGGFSIGEMLEDTYRWSSAPTGLLKIQGTNGYMAPEVQAAYDLKMEGRQTPPINAHYGRIDTYGLGLVLLQAATLKQVQGLNRAQNQDLLEDYLGEVQFAWLRDLLRDMLKFDYRERKRIKTLVSRINTDSTVRVF